MLEEKNRELSFTVLENDFTSILVMNDKIDQKMTNRD